MQRRCFRAIAQTSMTAVAPAPTSSAGSISFSIFVSSHLPERGSEGRVPLQVNLKSSGRANGYLGSGATVGRSGLNPAFLRGKGPDYFHGAERAAPHLRAPRPGAALVNRAGILGRLLARRDRAHVRP